MGGIASIVGTAERDRTLRMRRMRDALTHRGPDSAGQYSDPHAALGVRRLRIIDFVIGDQPQCGKHERVWNVFNGETYNFQKPRDELSHHGHKFRTFSDTEVILHLELWHREFAIA